MKLFGTDGIRGRYNHKITIDLAFDIGKAAATALNSSGRKICVGMDPRISSGSIQYAIIAGLISGGMKVTKFGVVSTPVISYAIINEDYDFGIMISASHNPYYDNGIKFFGSNGQKLADELEVKIEEIYLTKNYRLVNSEELSNVNEDAFIVDKYSKYIESLSCNLKGVKIALDCSNGSASFIAPEIYEGLGAEIAVIGNEPNGININDKIGSTYPETMSAFMQGKDFNFGFSYDGDADRVIMYSSNGEVMDGDYILYLLSKYYKENDKLNNDELITTIMVNLGLVNKLNELGISVVQTAVGDRYVMQKIKENNASLGGEQSGHIIIPKYLPTGDGILVSLILSKILVENNIELADIRQEMKKFPQVLLNKNVIDKTVAMERKELHEEIEKQELNMGAKGRILVRSSGTEELVRVMVEHEDVLKCREICEHLINFVY